MNKSASYSAIINSPVGKIGIKIVDEKLAALQFLSARAHAEAPKTPLAKKIVFQLNSYFENAKNSFDLPVELNGTILQKKIWQALLKIPVGKTVTYGALAQKLHTSPRVIGNACRRNPIPIVIPCHRVIAANGRLCGYCGATKGEALNTKSWLLQHEKY